MLETRVVEPERQVWKDLLPGQRCRHTGKTSKEGAKEGELNFCLSKQGSCDFCFVKLNFLYQSSGVYFAA